MKKVIIVRTRFEAIHSWLDCPYEDVAFLRNPHRHEFWVEVEIEVTHNDRDVEFIRAKRLLDLYIAEYYKGKDLGSMSCEDIAEGLFLAAELRRDICLFHSVTVLEDGENGAKVSQE